MRTVLLVIVLAIVIQSTIYAQAARYDNIWVLGTDISTGSTSSVWHLRFHAAINSNGIVLIRPEKNLVHVLPFSPSGVMFTADKVQDGVIRVYHAHVVASYNDTATRIVVFNGSSTNVGYYIDLPGAYPVYGIASVQETDFGPEKRLLGIGIVNGTSLGIVTSTTIYYYNISLPEQLNPLQVAAVGTDRSSVVVVFVGYNGTSYVAYVGEFAFAPPTNLSPLWMHRVELPGLSPPSSRSIPSIQTYLTERNNTVCVFASTYREFVLLYLTMNDLQAPVLIGSIAPIQIDSFWVLPRLTPSSLIIDGNTCLSITLIGSYNILIEVGDGWYNFWTLEYYNVSAIAFVGEDQRIYSAYHTLTHIKWIRDAIVPGIPPGITMNINYSLVNVTVVNTTYTTYTVQAASGFRTFSHLDVSANYTFSDEFILYNGLIIGLQENATLVFDSGQTINPVPRLFPYTLFVPYGESLDLGRIVNSTGSVLGYVVRHPKMVLYVNSAIARVEDRGSKIVIELDSPGLVSLNAPPGAIYKIVKDGRVLCKGDCDVLRDFTGVIVFDPITIEIWFAPATAGTLGSIAQPLTPWVFWGGVVTAVATMALLRLTRN